MIVRKQKEVEGEKFLEELEAVGEIYRKNKRICVRINQKSDMKTKAIPLMAIKSLNPGPTVLLTACIHGDEVGGMIIIQEIFKILKGNLLRGNIYAFPLLNPVGFENVSRYIFQSHKEDLNRSFPGKKEGTTAEKIAYEIFKMILGKKPDLVLDIHNDWRKSIPHNLIDYHEKIAKNQAYEKAKEISQQTGLITVLDSKDIEGTLSYNLIKQGIPALTMEFGEPHMMNEKNIKVGVKAIINVLRKLKMIKPAGKIFIHPAAVVLTGKILRYSDQSSLTNGIVRFRARPGKIVKKGEIVAEIYDVFGALQEKINASAKGIILGQTDSPVISSGTTVVSFGVEKF